MLITFTGLLTLQKLFVGSKGPLIRQCSVMTGTLTDL